MKRARNQDAAPVDRGRAVDALLAMADHERRAAFARWRKSGRALERVMAARAAQFLPDMLPELRAMLADADPWVRGEAFAVLAQLRPAEARRRISDTDLASRSARVREAIVGGVVLAMTTRVSRRIRAILRSCVRDASPAVRSWALLGMSFLATVDSSDIATATREARRSRSFEVRLEAIEMLTRHDQRAAHPAFIRELRRATLPPGIVIDLGRRLSTRGDRDALEEYWRRLSRKERTTYRPSWESFLNDLEARERSQRHDAVDQRRLARRGR